MKISKQAMDFINEKFPMTKTDVRSSYNAGYSVGQTGADIENCHFSLFQTEKHLNAWNEGKSDAENQLPNKYQLYEVGDKCKVMNKEGVIKAVRPKMFNTYIVYIPTLKKRLVFNHNYLEPKSID